MQISKEMLNRINALAAKKKKEGLTPAEQEEQKALYKDYLSAIIGQVREQLEDVKFIEDFTEEEIKKMNEK